MHITMTLGLILARRCWKPISHKSIELDILKQIVIGQSNPPVRSQGMCGFFLNVYQQALLFGFYFFIFFLVYCFVNLCTFII